MTIFLQNKIVLYVVAFISGTSLLNLVLTKKVNAVIFFIAVGYLTSFFNKNMIVIMLVALLSTNMLIHSRLTILREGMDKDDEEEGPQDFLDKHEIHLHLPAGATLTPCRSARRPSAPLTTELLGWPFSSFTMLMLIQPEIHAKP